MIIYQVYGRSFQAKLYLFWSLEKGTYTQFLDKSISSHNTQDTYKSHLQEFPKNKKETVPTILQ